MQYKTLAEHLDDLNNKEYSATELCSYYLERIEKLDPKLNSFISVTADKALAQAKAADKLRSQGNSPKLCGLPIAHKDLLCTKGDKTSCGSKMLDNFVSPYDATLVKYMAQNGVVCLGKLNMDEFAMGSSNETSYYGPVANPWDTSRVPGGSSGGSAAAIAARLVSGVTGTDTGGSIRQPAACCNITGIKPTYGRVSRFGLVAFASSLDQAGPMAQTALDCALLLEAMAGHDPLDSTSANTEVPEYSKTLEQSIKGKTIGIPKEFFPKNISPEYAKVLDAAIDNLKQAGASIVDVSLPNVNLAIPAYYVIAPAECSSNLSRYDGVRFGYRCENPKDLADMYKRSRAIGFGSEVKRRILVGTYVLSAGFYDAYYIKAQKIRQIIADDFKAAFAKVDAIFGPTTTGPAFKLGEKLQDPISMYLEDIYTSSVNLAGLPALSMPIGFVNNMPVGGQLIGNYFNEANILNIAHIFQQTTNWHKNVPKDFEGI